MEFADAFRAMHGAFATHLSADNRPETLVERVATQAFEFFEGNIALQTQGLPELACRKNCPSCCTLRVTATAPEIFLLAHYVRLIDKTPHGAQIGLPGRIGEISRLTRGLDEQQRMAIHQFCPLMLKGVCIVHPVRPLACRGHAAFDRAACARATRGRDVDVPISEPHRSLRFLVQSALQSALYRSGLAWGLYELTGALAAALADERISAAWLSGEDSLAPAVAETDMAETAAMFDAILSR
jgi:hypothetical protein